MMRKTIEINGIPVEFAASAATPRLYRAKYRRDIMLDMQRLAASMDKAQKKNSEFGVVDLELFENVAYMMARQANPDAVPDTPEEWLEQFDMFSIYEILPELFELWGMNIETAVESRKNLTGVAAGR